jgi:folate-dependent phosphoribosylglycinamide formyltransferase PurN
MKKKCLFIGTRIEALRTVEKLINVKLIITNKNSYIDKNRKNKILVDKKNKNKIHTLIDNIDVDIVFSAGYPYILSKKIINNKKKIFLNSHPSYLPFYRGRKCIYEAYINREKFYGVTLHIMDEMVDTGKIIYQEKVKQENKKIEVIYNNIFTKLEPKVIKSGLKKIL